MSDDDIKSGREALDLAAQLMSWRMLTKPRQQPRPPQRFFPHVGRSARVGDGLECGHPWAGILRVAGADFP